ncbi:MAG: SUMF1/EgtB/PvdO family nonheme iron enzyme [Treponema sp.]|jgi:formylglycine-generating enzyme required for sulfatase activity|nr:SUMF1/EgtB/PvdO family nonheme iron enzyme [Treponema sp.]
MSAETLPEDKVRLKPFLGMRPGVYLTIIYGLIILIILFFLLIFPGLTHPGSMIVLKTEPEGAALRVDGTYRGTSPGKIFVSRGTHTLELSLPGFTPITLEKEIPGRLFASVIFPLNYPLNAALAAPDPAEVLARSAADFAAWSFAGEPTVSYQIPLSLSEGAYRTGPALVKESEDVEDILHAAARFAVTRAALRDLVRAKTLIDNGGLSPSPFTLFQSAEDIIAYLSKENGMAAALAAVLPAESSSLITASPWYTKQAAAENAEKLAASAAGRLTVHGVPFTGLPGGILAEGPFSIPVGDFWIADAETDAAAFAAFLDANPEWQPEFLPELLKNGLVDEDYLADYSAPSNISNIGGVSERNSNGNSEGISNGNSFGISAVSWYAAAAFCSWLSNFLPPALSGWEVRLPAEAEWEYAAKSQMSAAALSLAGLPGENWEWCADPYAPLNLLSVSAEAAAAVGSPERSVRGSSRINSSSRAGIEARGSLPPESCSEFVSFRPVIARRTAALYESGVGAP